MGGVTLNLLAALLLTVAISSSAQQQSFLPGNSTELIRSSMYLPKITSKTSKLLPHKIKDRSHDDSIEEPNSFNQLRKKMKKWLKKKEEKEVQNVVVIPRDPTPMIDQSFPTSGSIPEDGCDSTSVRFDDGKCYPLMGRKPCGDPNLYVTVDPYTFKGRCTKRRCGRERVFVPRTGLCHDIYDESECTGGRRLYYSPYGDAVCDCPVGEFPFPYPRSDCVALFTQGPCPYGQVVAINSDESLSCMKSKCPAIYESDEYSSDYWKQKQKQLVPTSDGRCHELGTTSRCSGYDYTFSLLGLDILKNELKCVDVTDPSSPYSSSEEENELLDSIFGEFYAEYNLFPVYVAYLSVKQEHEAKYGNRKKGPTGTYERRQSGVVIGGPSNPQCRPGSGQEKCNNPSVPNTSQFRPPRSPAPARS